MGINFWVMDRSPLESGSMSNAARIASGNLELSYAKPRPKRPNRPGNPDELLDGSDDEPHNNREGDDENDWVVDDDICTDSGSGTVVGFVDAPQPQSDDNFAPVSRRRHHQLRTRGQVGKHRSSRYETDSMTSALTI